MTRLAYIAGLLMLAAGYCSGCSSGDRPDRAFDHRVAQPAYKGADPRVLFDEAHHNGHRARKSYRAFVKLIEADGYRVSTNAARFTANSLEPFSVLVIANALGTNERNDDPAFEEAECAAVRQWVAEGGALLLITDHYPTGHAAEGLAAQFGVRFSKGDVGDSTRYDAAFDEFHIVFSEDNGGFQRHPIIFGRDSSQAIHRVMTFAGQALYADPPAVGFLALSNSAVARSADPVVERRDGDVLVHVTYRDPVLVPGWSQGIALEHGRGRVVVLGEAAMLSAQLHRFDGHPIGMNVAGYDNRQMALNTMHWLTRLL
jgi:hypothetical protein